MLHLKTAKLARWQVRLLCWSGGALWLSGAIWLLLHYFGERQGEFGPEANPLQPWLLRVHGAAMIGALLGAGSLLVVHIWRGWGYRSQRVLGSVMTGATVLLIVTGYLLYYIGDDDWRAWTSLIYWIIGLIALPSFLLHYRQGRRLRRGSATFSSAR